MVAHRRRVEGLRCGSGKETRVVEVESTHGTPETSPASHRGGGPDRRTEHGSCGDASFGGPHGDAKV